MNEESGLQPEVHTVTDEKPITTHSPDDLARTLTVCTLVEVFGKATVGGKG
jgi:hypothetical protein